eukprot:tig00000227_g19811.t1
MILRDSNAPRRPGFLNALSAQFVAALISNAVLFAVFISLFMCCRNRNKMTYQPRALRPESLVQPVSTGLFSWLYDTLFLYSDEVIYRASGIDYVMYLRYIKMVAIVLFTQLFFGCVVLFPIHATGEYADGRAVVLTTSGNSTVPTEEKIEGLQRIYMTNVAPRSNRLIAHIFSVIINTFVTLYMFNRDYKEYINYRLRAITECRSQNYTLMITELPVNTMSEVEMEKALSKTYGKEKLRRRREKRRGKPEDEKEEKDAKGGTAARDLPPKDDKAEQAIYEYDKHKKRYIEGTFVDLDLVYKIPDLGKRIEERNEAELALEKAIAEAKKTGRRPMHTPSSGAARLVSSLIGGDAGGPTGPVDSIEFHRKAIEAADADIMAMRALVESSNNDKEAAKRQKGLDTVQVAFARLTSIFAVRAGVQRQLVKEALPGSSCYRAPAHSLELSSVGIFLFLLIFFWAIPMTFIQGVANLQNLFAIFGAREKASEVPTAIAAWIEGFLPTLLLIIFNILLPIIIRLCAHLMGIFTEGLADDFLYTHIMIYALSALPMQLWRPGPLIVRWLKRKWLCKTPRDFELADQPEDISYPIKYADHSLILMITLCYSTTSPFIVIWGFIYFAIAFVVNRYNILFVYIPPYQASGSLWRSAYDCILWGLLVYHLFMIFMFLTYEFFAGAAVTFIVIFATFAFWVLIADRGERDFQSRVLAAAAAADVVNAVSRDEMFAKTRHSYRQPELQPDGTQKHYVAHPPKGKATELLEAAVSNRRL